MLRVDYQAGRGIGNRKVRRESEKESDGEWSFLLWQFGQPQLCSLHASDLKARSHECERCTHECVRHDLVRLH
jgi:hypothetical protein